MVDPESVEEIAQGIADALARGDELSRKGLVRASTFSWERCAKETAAAYKAVEL